MGKIVLIFTPTWIDEQTQADAIRPECAAAIKSQIIDGEFDWHVTTDNPFPIGDLRNVLHQYQQAREYFLQGDWEMFLSIEHDCRLPDEHALQRLLETPGDIVYAPYMLRHNLMILNTWRFINWQRMTYINDSLTRYPHELSQARQAIVHQVSGAGFGCTLCKRQVLKEIEFTGPTDRDKNACPDLRFAETALHKRFMSNGRFDVPVQHYHDGVWLDPYKPNPRQVRLDARRRALAARRVA